MIFIPCASGNYSQGRRAPVQYLVVHYTAGDGDTAQGNLRYFAGNTVKASAHYFVDENEICRSVRDEDTAWHCGASVYRHPLCRNSNSIGIEICSRINDRGQYELPEGAVVRAAELVRQLMRQYDIPAENVLRHFDVTGKNCPAPMVENETLWHAFLESVRAQEQEEILTMQDFGASAYAQEAAQWAIEQGYIKGDGQGNYKWQSALTREAFAVILKRFAEANGLS